MRKAIITEEQAEAIRQANRELEEAENAIEAVHQRKVKEQESIRVIFEEVEAEAKASRLKALAKYIPILHNIAQEVANAKGYDFINPVQDNPEILLFQFVQKVMPDKLTDHVFKVQLVTDNRGNPIEDNMPHWDNYEGIIRSVDNGANEICLRVCNGSDTWYSRPFEFTLISDITLLLPENIPAFIRQHAKRKLEAIINYHNEIKQGEKKNTEYAIADRKKNIEYHAENLKREKDLLTPLEEKLKNLVVIDYTTKSLKKEIAKIQKLSLITTAYLSKDLTLTILTKPLYGTDPITHTISKFNIGRLYINIQLGNRFRVRVYNLDYVSFGKRRVLAPTVSTRIADKNSDRYYHPNIHVGEVCWGDHGNYVNGLLRNANFYVFTDFLLTFFSTYPHDGGNPYINFTTWKRARSVITKLIDVQYTIPQELKKW